MRGEEEKTQSGVDDQRWEDGQAYSDCLRVSSNAGAAILTPLLDRINERMNAGDNDWSACSARCRSPPQVSTHCQKPVACDIAYLCLDGRAWKGAET